MSASGGAVVITDQHFDGLVNAAIYAYGATSVTIERCTFANVGTAIRLVECADVTITDCAGWNMTGIGGGSTNTGNFVQLDKCTTATVADSWCVNVADANDVEDVISVYRSTAVTVARNQLFGCGPSVSGSGIMLGDGGNSSDLTCEDNVLVQTGNVGIGVASGVGVAVRRNLVLSAETATSNVGAYTWEQYGDACSLVSWTSNRVLWFKAGGIASHYVDLGGCGAPTLTSNTFGDLTLSADIFNPSGYYGWEG